MCALHASALALQGEGGQKIGFNRVVCGDQSISAGAGWAASLLEEWRMNLTFTRLPALTGRNSDFSVAVEGGRAKPSAPSRAPCVEGSWGLLGRCYAVVKASVHQTGRSL